MVLWIGMRTLFLFISLAFILAISAGAQTRNSSPVDNPNEKCPRGFTYPDGCAGAPTAGSFQRRDFFTYARQSGQTYTTRPPWNVAGVDYAVGIPAASLPLKDPSTLGSSIPGCTYNRVSSSILCGGEKCSSPTFDGYDFGLHNGTWIEFQVTCIGTITIKNSNLKNGTNSNRQFGFIFVNGGSANLSLLSNAIDGSAQNFPGSVQTKFVRSFTSGTLTSKYNVWLNISGNNVLARGAYVTQFDYCEGINYDNAQHGEWTDVSASGGINPLFQVSYSTYLGPSTFGGGITTTIYASGGVADGSTITTVQIDHNTFVQNLFQFRGSISGKILTVSEINTTAASAVPYNGMPILGSGISANTRIRGAGAGGGIGDYPVNNSQMVANKILSSPPSSAAGVEVAYISINNLIYTANYLDPTGALTCFVDVGGISNLTGSISGTTLTLTGVPAPTVISVGQKVTGVGVMPGTLITAYLAGSGKTGTYIVNHAQSVSSQSLGVDGIRPSPKMTGNINLLDGSTITDTNATNCHGHH